MLSTTATNWISSEYLYPSRRSDAKRCKHLLTIITRRSNLKPMFQFAVGKAADQLDFGLLDVVAAFIWRLPAEKWVSLSRDHVFELRPLLWGEKWKTYRKWIWPRVGTKQATGNCWGWTDRPQTWGEKFRRLLLLLSGCSWDSLQPRSFFVKCPHLNGRHHRQRETLFQWKMPSISIGSKPSGVSLKIDFYEMSTKWPVN